jgi:MFS family permease
MKEEPTFKFDWIIVSVSFLNLALVYAIWYSFSVFFVAILKDFGWSRSLTAGAFSLFIIIHGIIGLFVGWMVDRFGPRRVILLGSLFLGTGLTLCSLIHTWWQFYLFWGVITAGGIGSTGWVPNVAIINQRFKEKKGLAMGIISSGIGIGMLVLTPSFQFLINQIGWRMTYRIIALFIPSIVIIIAIAFLKKFQKTIPIPLAEEEVYQTVMKDPLIANEEWASKTWTVWWAIKTKQFWLMGFSFFSGSFITQSIFTHQVAFFVDHGIEALFASYLVGLIGIVSIAGKILWGALSDKIGREITFTIGIIFSISGMIILILFSFYPFLGLTYFFSICLGLGYAVTAALPPLIIADIFEGKAFGSIFGSIMVFVGIGGAIGAWFAGFIYDQLGSYVPLFIILIPLALFACLNVWRAAPRKIRMVPGKR